MYRQGDIVLIPFPYSDLSATKQRPVLVLSNTNYNKMQSDLVVAAITSNLTSKTPLELPPPDSRPLPNRTDLLRAWPGSQETYTMHAGRSSSIVASSAGSHPFRGGSTTIASGATPLAYHYDYRSKVEQSLKQKTAQLLGCFYEFIIFFIMLLVH